MPDAQQAGSLLPQPSTSQLSTKVPNGRGARIRPQATRGLLRQRSIRAVVEPPVLPFEKDAEHLSQWRPESWRQLKAYQQPNYRDEKKLRDAVETITRMPPLVFAGECRNLQSRLAKCAAGEAFLLQGEPCTKHIGACVQNLKIASNAFRSPQPSHALHPGCIADLS